MCALYCAYICYKPLRRLQAYRMRVRIHPED